MCVRVETGRRQHVTRLDTLLHRVAILDESRARDMWKACVDMAIGDNPEAFFDDDDNDDDDENDIGALESRERLALTHCGGVVARTNFEPRQKKRVFLLPCFFSSSFAWDRLARARVVLTLADFGEGERERDPTHVIIIIIIIDVARLSSADRLRQRR